MNLLTKLLRRPPAPITAPAIPFRPYNSLQLTPAQMRDSLRGQGQALPVAAVIQLLEARIGVAVAEMAEGREGARGTYRHLREFYDGVLTLLDVPGEPTN